ncbi:hypothetical protein HYV91_01170 [Candidatus Wolfebacteria bacterium]|nr:hypothetical protein [Candidatus Wolfebacteria bacterium]
MPLQTRRLLFYSLVLLFIILGFIIVFYSRGWRLSAENCRALQLLNCSIKFEKTGAIFLETKPRDVIIRLNEKLFKDKSGLIQSGTLIDDLLPANYKLKIEKDGFLSWEKNIIVKPGMVAEAKNALLIPKEIKKEVINISKIRGDVIIAVSRGGEKFILKDSKKNIYYLYDIKDLSVAYNINLKLKNLKGAASIRKVDFYPFDSDKLITETEAELGTLDILRGEYRTVRKEAFFLWTTKSAGLYYLNELEGKKADYVISLYNLVLQSDNKLADFSLSGNISAKPIKFEVDKEEKRAAFLTVSGELYIAEFSTNNAKKMKSGVTDFSFSEDGKKMAILEKGELSILFLEDSDINNRKHAGENASLPSLRPVSGMRWHKDSLHLFLEGKDGVDFEEIDDRPNVNIFPLITENKFSFAYEPQSNFGYLLIDKLYRFSLE